MGRLRGMPDSLIGRARAGALGFALLVGLTQVPQIDYRGPGELILTALLAMAGLLVQAVVTFVRGRTLPLDPVLSALLVVAAGAALIDPMGTVALSMCPLIGLLSYGSNRTAVARVVFVSLTIPVTLAVSPNTHLLGGHRWYDPSTMGAVLMMVLSGLPIRGIYLLLQRHELASARSGVLASTGHRLLDCRDLAGADALIWRAVLDLRSLTPGLGVVSARRDGDAYVVDAAAGPAVPAPGTRLPAGAALDPPDGGPPLVGFRRWQAFRAGSRVLLVGSARTINGDVVDAFANLGAQAELAEGNCTAHTELVWQARHDQLTALPNRATLFARLASLADAPTRGGRHVLMVIDLDDFKDVNDTYGHAAGDAVLVAVARRLAAAAGGTGLAARFGGDEFALLLTGIAADDVAGLAEQVCRDLHSPVVVGAATVTVGASIGVVDLAPGLTAGDHMRCADLAMYGAKARGKNRVERFDAALHGGVATLGMPADHLTRGIAGGEYRPLLRAGGADGR